MAKQKLQLQHLPKFNLRLQPDLKEALEKLARKASHSLNAEITERLENSLLKQKDLKDFSDGELLDEIIRRWGRDEIQLSIRENKEDN